MIKTVNNALTTENPSGTGVVVANNTLSLWDGAPVGWTGKINSVTNPAKINGISAVNITKVNGVL